MWVKRGATTSKKLWENEQNRHNKTEIKSNGD